MVIITAKLDRKKAVAILIGLAVVLAALILLFGKRGGGETSNVVPPDVIPVPGATAQITRPTPQTAPKPDNLSTNTDRVAYLESLGWLVDESPLESVDVVIPGEFTGAYAQYAELQSKQGFNLSDYAGQRATRYTYKVLNYPTQETDVLADIIVCGTVLIAGDIQSPSLNGFMHEIVGFVG